MSIASELQNYADGLDDAWDAAEDMGATIPTDRNMNNLDDAIRTIPVSSPNDGVLTITQNGTTIQTFSADQATNVTAALTDTTYSDFTGATSSVAGAAGLVPAPTTADPDKYLKGDGSWGTPTGTTYTAGTNVSISAQNVISATDTTYSTFTTDLNGLVPGPSAAEVSAGDKFLKADGSWATVQSGGANGAFYLSNYLPYSGTQTGIIAYKDRACTTPATYEEVYNAIRNGSCAFSYGYMSQGSIESETIYTVESGDYTDNTDEGDNRFVVVDAAGKRYVLYPEDEDDPGYPNLTATFAEDGTYDYAKDGDIPTVNDATLTITQNGTTAGTFSANASSAATIALTDTTYSDFTGATSSVAGAHGLVPAPAAGDEGKALHGDGTWKDTTAKLVEMSYGESNAWAKFIAAYNAGSIVYCRASSNSNPASGSQTRKAFMAYVNNATSPTSVEFQYVRSVSSKTDSQQCDQVFVYTLTNASGGTWSVASRNMSPKINVSGAITKTFSNGANATVTIGANAMTGATSSADGAAGIVPKPVTGDNVKVLKGDGTWGKVVNDNIDWSTVPSSYTECTTTGSPHPPTAGNCKISKIGKIVNLQVNYTYSGGDVFDLAAFGDVIIADIPDGYRPPFHIYGAAMLKFTSSTVSGSLINTVHLWASSSGYLLINNMDAGAITGITSIRGNLTWFVA